MIYGRVQTFVQARGQPPKDFVMPKAWKHDNKRHSGNKSNQSGSRFQRAGGSPPSSDDGSSSDDSRDSTPPPSDGTNRDKTGSDKEDTDSGTSSSKSGGYLRLCSIAKCHGSSNRYHGKKAATFRPPALNLPSFSGRNQSFEAWV